MPGPLRTSLWSLCLLLIFAESGLAQPREATGPIGGITFQPARRATIRHKGGQLIRGSLIAISPETVHFRVGNGKEFHYDLKTIRSIATVDGEFRYASAYDTYRELVERAQPLTGVTIADAASPGGGGLPREIPTPPPPPMPKVVDSPENYAVVRIDPVENGGTQAATPGQIPGIPAMPPPPPAAASSTGVGQQPLYETGAFKIGFLVSCFVVILLWWRNRVG